MKKLLVAFVLSLFIFWQLPQLALAKEKVDPEDFYYAVEAIYRIAELHNSINDYELFLKATSTVPLTYSEPRKQVFHNIYTLVKQADLVDGYIYFLKNYSTYSEVNPFDIIDANQRLYEISFEVADIEGTIPAYYEFLSNFREAPNIFRNHAIDNVTSLECNVSYSKLEDSLSYINDDSLLREFTIEKIARGLYEDAVNAKNAGNESIFIGKYNTIMKCDLFKASNAKFMLLRDSEMKKSLDEIKVELTNIKQNVQKLTELTINNFATLNHKIDAQDSAYLQKFEIILEQQQQLINIEEKPYNYDKSLTPWLNFLEFGSIILDIIPQTRYILEILRAI